MESWLRAAIDYVPQWLDFQLRLFEQPGCVIAIAHRGEIVLERALGHADALRGTKLTPRHRFRVASHSKSFTAAAIMKLREQGALRLDDPAGRYVDGLHPRIAEATVAQLISHGAGIIRDGRDAGQWQDRRPFLNARELGAALAEPPILGTSERFKYSNHGFGLAGLVIEAVTSEPYATWMQREIVAACGLRETAPDMPIARGAKLATGHSGKLPLGRRVAIPGDNPTNALAPATGFVSSAADLAQFFAQLDPAAGGSILSRASRREMIRRQWRDPHGSLGRHYGLGIMSGTVGDWEWYGHGGAFQGFISRTVMLPGRSVAISVVTNAIDGMANQWSDGVIHILRAFERHGGPSARTRDWSGRWWTAWTAVDLVPTRERVLVAVPALPAPFTDASEIEITGRDRGRIALANGFASHGEEVRRLRSSGGAVTALQLAGAQLRSEARTKTELLARYGGRRRR